MAKRIFISFDYDHDRTYRYLLRALSANPRSDLHFDDLTPEEIDTRDVGRVKAALTTRIRAATHTLVIVGAYANSPHPDQSLIGTRNWQWWEIEKSIAERKRLVGVKISSAYKAPVPMLERGVSWAMNFEVDSIIQAIDRA